MVRPLAEEVSRILREPANGGTSSVAGLARRLGVSTALVSSCAQGMIADGTATGVQVTNRGRLELRGLRLVAAESASETPTPGS